MVEFKAEATSLTCLAVFKMGMQDLERSIWQTFDFDWVAPLSFLSGLEWSVPLRLDHEEIASSMAHSFDEQKLCRFVSLPSLRAGYLGGHDICCNQLEQNWLQAHQHIVCQC